MTESAGFEEPYSSGCETAGPCALPPPPEGEERGGGGRAYGDGELELSPAGFKEPHSFQTADLGEGSMV